jgi:hypothetical protein
VAAFVLDRNGIPDQPVYFRNNILPRGRDGVKGSGRSEGKATFDFYMCRGQSCEEGAVDGNIIAGVDLRLYPQRTMNLCPTERSCTPDYSVLKFADPSKGDYSLTADAPLRAAATDGGDIGVDMSQLPRIRNLRVHTAPTKAVVYYDLSPSIQHIPCVLEVSTKRDFSAPVPDVNPALFERADSDRRPGAVTDGPYHSFVVGNNTTQTGMDGNAWSRALAPVTEYFFRLQCGGDTRTGSFRTADPTVSGSVTMTVPVPAREGAVQAFVEYGHAEQGAPYSFTQRTDPVPCDSGCSIPVDVQRGSVVYFRAVYMTPQFELLPAALQALAIE